MGSSPQQDGRVAAIDLGKVRVGVAVSDELRLLAHPRPHLDGKSLTAVLEALGELARDEGIVRFLVGYPLSMSGAEGTAARRVVRFCQKLADASGVEVELVDERLTSVQAHRALREAGRRDHAGHVDSASAAILLQQWLDSQ